jgi:ribonuclease HI
MAGTQTAKSSSAKLTRNIKRLPNGDVYIDGIPMVNQGEKGYCAAAAAERVLSYYGTDTDQHELAQRMMMQTGGGASFESMIKGLRAIAHTLNIQLKMLMEQDERAFERMVEDYNREAKKAHAQPIDLYRRDTAYTNIWDLFDNNLFLKSRLKEKASIERFFKIVQEKVNEGIPVCQCCIIGILPEEAKIGQAPGGHLRLLIGYNLKTREVLYTDSWGPGHERKRMGLGPAFAITTGLFTMEPKS